MTLIVHTDGASRGNPGPAAAAFIITDSSGKLITQSGEFLGTTTNNQAEYHAVLLALTWINKNLNTEGFAPNKLSKLANLRVRLLPSEATRAADRRGGLAPSPDGHRDEWVTANEQISANEIAGAKQLRITFYLDSELVARQLSGQYKIKSKQLLPLAIKIKNLQNSLASPKPSAKAGPIFQIVFHSIPRDLNKPADRLVNQVLDSQLI